MYNYHDKNLFTTCHFFGRNIYIFYTMQIGVFFYFQLQGVFINKYTLLINALHEKLSKLQKFITINYSSTFLYNRNILLIFMLKNPKNKRGPLEIIVVSAKVALAIQYWSTVDMPVHGPSWHNHNIDATVCSVSIIIHRFSDLPHSYKYDPTQRICT